MAILTSITVNDTGFIKLPSGTVSQRPVGLSTGYMRYNSDLGSNEMYSGNQWTDVTTGASSIVTNGLVLILDAGSPRSYGQNEFKFSTDIFSWAGSSGHTAATITRDTISSPVGNTPLKMAVTGNDPHLGTYNSGTWNIAPAANGQTWVVSVYVKASTSTTGEILIFGANSSGAAFVNGNWLTFTSTTVNITTEWTRVSHYITMNNASIAYIHVRLDGPNIDGTGQTVWWDGLQVEKVSSGVTTPTIFNPRNDVWYDLCSGNNAALFNGVSYSSSNGGTLVFDGSNDYASISSVQVAPGTGAFTWNFWVKLNDLTTYSIPFSGAGSNSNYGVISMDPRVGGGLIYYALATRINDSNNSFGSSWWYITFTGNGGSNGSRNLKLYRNAVQAGSTYTYDYNFTATTPNIGANHDSYAELMRGNIANVSYYNRALLESEITNNYNALKGRFGL